MDQTHPRRTQRFNVFTPTIQMRFTPALFQPNSSQSTPTFFQRFKSMIFKKQESHDPALPEPSPPTPCRLRFIEKVTPQHLLLGNQSQIDFIHLHLTKNNKLITDHIWSYQPPIQIDELILHSKKNFFVTGNKSQRKIMLYLLGERNLKRLPVLHDQIQLRESIRHLVSFKDHIVVIASHSLFVYSFDQQNKFVPVSRQRLRFPQKNEYNFFQVASIGNYLNIYFEQEINSKLFCRLWRIEVQFHGNRTVINQAKVFYDVKKSRKKSISLKHYSKDLIIMNEGQKILLFKNGYVLDILYINFRLQNSVLCFTESENIAHLNHRSFQLYHWTLYQERQPYSMLVRPIDYANIEMPEESQLWKIIQVFDHHFLIIYQIKPSRNNKKKGEINYWMTLSYFLSRQQKIKSIFQSKFPTIPNEEIDKKLDAALKIGMSKKQSYLELWKRSKKTLEKDMEFLIKINDYLIIDHQVYDLLRTRQVSFDKIQSVYSKCKQMLKGEIFKQNSVTSKIILNYSECNFFLEKLQIYNKEHSSFISPQKRKRMKSKKLMMTFQEFKSLKKYELKKRILQIVQSICHQNKPEENRLRLYLCQFRLYLRNGYQNLLCQIVKCAKDRLFNLLEKIPELLPYEPDTYQENPPFSEPDRFYEGIWPRVRSESMDITLNTFSRFSLENESIIKQLTSQVEVKRGMFQTHAFPTENEETQNKNLNQLKSPFLFNYFIQLIIKFVRSEQVMKTLFTFIENNYDFLHNHLKGKIIHYKQIYFFLKQHGLLPIRNKKSVNFQEFLTMDELDLFNHFFIKEKEHHGLILKQIKKIYDKNIVPGKKIFNQILCKYFKSPISKVADLKAILNRVNNQKIDFHLQNQDLYDIFLEAVEYKVILGSGNDVPVSELLVYFKRILYDISSETLLKINQINRISRQAQLLKESKINKPIIEIIEQPEEVLQKVILHLITKEKLSRKNRDEKFIQKAYIILNTVQIMSKDLYPFEVNSIIFFLFLIEIGKDIEMLKFVKKILSDKVILDKFEVNEKTIESFAIFLYREKLIKIPVYVRHEQYLRGLLQVLQEKNEARSFLLCQFQFANLLSSFNDPIEYPISTKYVVPSPIELGEILKKIPYEKLKKIDIQIIFKLMDRMRKSSRQISDFFLDNSALITPPEFTIKDVYEQFLLTYMFYGHIKDVLPLLTKRLRESQGKREYNIVFIICYLIGIENELNQSQKKMFSKIVSLYFQRPTEVLSIIDTFVNKKCKNIEKTEFLQEAVLKGQVYSKGYNVESKLLNEKLLKIAKEGREQKLIIILQNSFHYFEKIYKGFSKFKYGFIYIMIINSPYTLIKYILCHKNLEVLDQIYDFLNYLTNQSIFNKLNILQMGRRICLIILHSKFYEMKVEKAIQMFLQYPIEHQLPESLSISASELQKQDLLVLHKYAQNFRRKKEKCQLNMLKRPRSMFQEKEKQFLRTLEDPDFISIKSFHQFSKIMKKTQNPKNQVVLEQEKQTKSSIIRCYMDDIKKSKIQVKPDISNALLSPISQQLLQTQSFQVNQHDQSKRNFIQEEKIIKKQKKKTSSTRVKKVQQEETQEEKFDTFLGRSNVLRKVESNQKRVRSRGSLESRFSDPDIVIHEHQEYAEQYREKQQKHKQFQTSLNLLQVKSKQFEAQPSVSVLETVQQMNAKFKGLPTIQEMSESLFQVNETELSHKNQRLFNIKPLQQIENEANFSPSYIEQIIKYIYEKCQMNRYVEVMHMIDFIAAKYLQKQIIRSHLQVFVRGYVLERNCSLGYLSLKELLPIQLVFKKPKSFDELFQILFDRFKNLINELTVEILAQFFSLLFRNQIIQSKVLYYYLYKLIQKIDKKMDETEQIEGKIAIYINKMQIPFLLDHLAEIMRKTKNLNLLKKILKELLQKINKSKKSEYKKKIITLINLEIPQCEYKKQVEQIVQQIKLK